MLAKDLSELIQKYGPAMANTAEETLKPIVTPEMIKAMDWSALEQERTKNSGKKFFFFDSQKEKMTGLLHGLKKYQKAWLIAEMGSGKSPMSLGSAWQLLKNRVKPKIFIMCPSHLTKKWKREVEWLIPNVNCVLVKTLNDMLKFKSDADKHDGFSVAVVSKEAAKLGFDVDRPCASRKRFRGTRYLNDASEMKPGDSNFMPRDDMSPYQLQVNGQPKFKVDSFYEAVQCPTCGNVLKDANDTPIRHDDYILKDNPDTCECGTKLSTSCRGFRSNAHMDRFIQRKMNGYFHLMIADEVHELASSDSIQGNTFGTIAASCKYTIAMTGSLIGGKAVDLHASLWRISPDLMIRRGFNLQNLKGGKLGPLGRNANTFSEVYGVMEQEIHRPIAGESNWRYRRGKTGRRKQFASDKRPRPGISPDLFNHFLTGRAVFMSLSELGPALPTIERSLIPIEMSEALKQNYKDIDDAITETMTNDRRLMKYLATRRIQVLDAYLDRPWGWEPITAPYFDEDGSMGGHVTVVQPPDMGELHVDNKDRKLVEMCKEELNQGRRCCVYPVYTMKHDCREKVKTVLEQAGLKAVIMPDSIKPINREEWIMNNIDDIEVLIVHPRRVMTGLDLIQFPTLIWFQVGYSTHVLRQASARARRPIQTLPCKVIFIYYKDTIQQQALSLMGEKEAASQALEGKFDTRGLKALMNGGESDDILLALSEGIKSVDPELTWKEVDKSENPFVRTPEKVPAITAELPKQPPMKRNIAKSEHYSIRQLVLF